MERKPEELRRTLWSTLRVVLVLALASVGGKFWGESISPGKVLQTQNAQSDQG